MLQLSASLNPHRRSFFLCELVVSREIFLQLDNMQKERDFWAFITNRMFPSNPSSQGSEIYVEEKGEKL